MVRSKIDPSYAESVSFSTGEDELREGEGGGMEKWERMLISETPTRSLVPSWEWTKKVQRGKEERERGAKYDKYFGRRSGRKDGEE